MSLDQRIQQARERAIRRDRLKAKIKTAQSLYACEYADADELLDRLEKEERDVARLESFTITSLLCSIMGQKSSRLERERKEELLAQLTYARQKNIAEKSLAEINRLESESASLEDAEDEYRILLAEKERELKRSAGPVSLKLFELADRMGVTASTLQEFDEAIAAGQALVRCLDDAESSLDESQAPQFVSAGRTAANVEKLRHIAFADAVLSEIPVFAGRFQKELSDLNIRMLPIPDLHTGVSKLDELLVVFSENSVSVPWKVHTALKRIHPVRGNVAAVTHHLTKKRKALFQEYQTLRKERDKLVLNE